MSETADANVKVDVEVQNLDTLDKIITKQVRNVAICMASVIVVKILTREAAYTISSLVRDASYAKLHPRRA